MLVWVCECCRFRCFGLITVLLCGVGVAWLVVCWSWLWLLVCCVVYTVNSVGHLLFLLVFVLLLFCDYALFVVCSLGDVFAVLLF